MKTTPAQTVDAYIISFPEKVRTALQDLRETIKSVVPEAEEVISYQIPTFKWNGGLAALAGFPNHCSFFPMSTSLPEELTRETRLYLSGKTTIRFTPEKPLPKTLVKEIVKARMKENEARRLAKKRQKK